MISGRNDTLLKGFMAGLIFLALWCPVLTRNGAPGGIRTPDPQIRSLMLYPAELQARRPSVIGKSVGLQAARGGPRRGAGLTPRAERATEAA